MRVISAVTHYLWQLEDGFFEVQRELWWDGTLEPKPNGKGNYIVLQPPWEQYTQPDLERLECGHEQPVRQGYGGKYYNLRRRCDTCAFLSTNAISPL